MKWIIIRICYAGMMIQNIHAIMCDNIVAYGNPEAEAESTMTCERFMQGIDTMQLYRREHAHTENCMYLKSLTRKIDFIDENFGCHCPAGFTDASFDIKSHGISNETSIRLLQHITCAQPCPALYQSIVKTENTQVCACMNTIGCFFQVIHRHFLCNSYVIPM